MIKVFGTKVRQDGIYKIAEGLYELFYGFYTEPDGSTWEWRQKFAGKAPKPREIKDLILDTISAEIDRRILTGFSWQGLPVLFTEEQKFTHEVAFQASKDLQQIGAYQPVVLKLSEDEDRNDVVYRFETFEELKAYHDAAFAFQQQVYAEAAAERRAIDWSKFDAVVDLTRTDP